MNRTLENKLSMYLAVQKVCADNESIWTEVPACQDAISEFSNKIIDIVNARQIQENSALGITQDKSIKRASMANNAMLIKSALQAYATDRDNNELYENVNYSLTELLKPSDTVARDRSLLIYNKANEIATDLVSYGITASMLTNLQTSIDDFVAIMVTPRTARSTIKSATSSINNLFIDTDLILKRKIDKLFIQFKTNNDAFYNTYLNSRQIVDSGKGSKTIEVIINANETKTVQRVINGSVLTNTGTTTLRYCADRLPPCDAGDEGSMHILAGSSIDIIIDKPFVTLTNMDSTTAGKFKVKVTSTIPIGPR